MGRDRDLWTWRAVKRFYEEGKTVKQIADGLTKETGGDPDFTPQKVYLMLQRAAKAGMLELWAPRHHVLEGLVKILYLSGRPEAGVTVVTGSGAGDSKAVRGDELDVALTAAQMAFELALEIHKKKPPGAAVGIGLGPGRAALDFAIQFARLLDAHDDPIRLSLFALTAGGIAGHPEQSPIGFFNIFHDGRIAHRYGMFASTVVRKRDLAEQKRLAGVAETFEHKHEIDIIVSGMGQADDPHDLLAHPMREMYQGRPDGDLTRVLGVGNVQYRPFDDRPIIEGDDDYRAVTLFELDELSDLVRQGKPVILMARPCGGCGQTRAKALHALLRSSALHIFSELIVDVRTARELVAVYESERPLPAGAAQLMATSARWRGPRARRNQ
jgi:DNA-binding transcriptional regulator LsrR (DeoR family)